MALYESPFWMPSRPDIESPYMFAPLSFPGFNQGGQAHAVANFRALGHSQNAFKGKNGFITSNICGSEKFQREDASYTNLVYNFTLLKNETKRYSTVREYDYVVIDEALPDLIDEDGVHTPQWKPVITFTQIINLAQGDPQARTGGDVQSAELQNNYYIDEKNERKHGGKSTLSKPIEMEYLKEKLKKWKGLPSSARRRTETLGYYGNAITTTESKSGQKCSITGGQWYFRSNIAADYGVVGDYGYAKGWPGQARVHVPHVQRQNAPEIEDKLHPNAYELYNVGFTEEILLDEITDGQWLDQYGRYDPTGLATFSDMGWRPVDFMELQHERAILAPALLGGAGRVRLRSADGNDYRLTIEYKGYVGGATELSVTRTVTVSVSPSSPGEFELLGPPTDFPPAEIVIARAEKNSGDGYAEVPSSDLVRSLPYPGVGMLCAIQTRSGRRWGFHALDIPSDTDPMPANVNSYYQRKIFRQSHRAISAS